MAKTTFFSSDELASGQGTPRDPHTPHQLDLSQDYRYQEVLEDKEAVSVSQYLVCCGTKRGDVGVVPCLSVSHRRTLLQHPPVSLCCWSLRGQ